MKANKSEILYLREVINGVLHMECKQCGTMTPCGEDATAVTCPDCCRENFEKDFPFQPTTGYKPTGRPRGWAFMKEFVDKEGNVFHKGKEKPELKGTLQPTVIKPKPAKPKLTKAQKQDIRAKAFAKIHKLKKQLGKVKYKKDIKKINSEIKKLQKIVK